MSQKHPDLVIGDGWSALGAVALLAQSGREVCWLVGTGARMIPALPFLEAGQGADVWKTLASSLGIETGELETGSFLREFRNKAFREPAWTKAPTPEMRHQVRDEVLWAPERRLAPAFDVRFTQLTLAELEEEMRKLLYGEGSNFKNIKRIEGLPVTGFKIEEKKIQAVILGSGEEIACERLFYADRWSSLPKIQGMPKPVPFLRKRDPMGVLQATFLHEHPVGVGLMEGFFAGLHKEAGEEIERNAWGYFSSNGRRSYWTVCLSPEEVEDNHQIAKKFRRIKGMLDRVFVGTEWLPEGKKDFMSNVQGEQIRFDEAVVFSDGEAVSEPLSLPQIEGAFFLTDGYGPSYAMAQAWTLVNPVGTETQAEAVDASDARAPELSGS